MDLDSDYPSTMKGFFSTFPALRKNKFWVTGESYGGHYVPTAAQYILERNADPQNPLPKINLVGLQVGMTKRKRKGNLLRKLWKNLFITSRLDFITVHLL